MAAWVIIKKRGGKGIQRLFGSLKRKLSGQKFKDMVRNGNKNNYEKSGPEFKQIMA